MLVDLQVLSSQTEHRYLLLLITSIIFRKVLKHCKFTVSQSLHRNPPGLNSDFRGAATPTGFLASRSFTISLLVTNVTR